MQYAATIFLSSFLLFLVQPLIARVILPWFGGSAAVWTTCMLFFQALLLAGYAYAHFLEGRIRSKTVQAAIHTVLLAAAVALLPIAPGESWKPLGNEEPVGYIVRLLGASVGLQYFLLASTSPLIQAWFARARPGADPYRLFALSNVASLAALIGYPFVVEPNLAAREQVSLWSWLFAAFALACAAVAWTTPAAQPTRYADASDGKTRPGTLLMWLALSATGSVLLLSITNHLTQNVGAVPLLWLAPLSLYLLSFILAFGGERWYRPAFMWPAVVAALGAMAWMLADPQFHFDLPLQFGVFLAGLFIGCMFCHGELYRMRPAAGQLTLFYLAVSAGGALGGVLVAVLAPMVFNAYFELAIGLTGLAALAALRYAKLAGMTGRVARYASLVVLAGVAGAGAYDAYRYHQDVSISTRSFYGVLRVKEYGTAGEDGHVKRLVHGAIMHGEQYMTGQNRHYITTYYRPTAGVGAAIQARQQSGSVHVGIIGLGTGTLAGYGRRGDEFRFYDIDRRVMDIAKSEFTFLGDSDARVALVLGDARLTLEREPAQGFDVLAVDAFSSDSIPVHLITREALRAYLRHMKPEGIVAFHVSNRFLDLIPVVARVAAEEGAHAVLVSDDPPENDDSRRSRSDWVLVSRSKESLGHPVIRAAGAVPAEDRPGWRTWTDDYSNLIQILK